MDTDENPTIIYSIYRDTDAQFVLFVTKNGLVKKTSLDEYVKTKKKTGIAAISIKEDDELVSVSLIKDEPLILLTKNGMGIKFSSLEVGATSRVTAGVKGINLGTEDEVVAALPVRDEKDYLAVFATNGMAKKFASSELPLQKRAGKGLICSKTELAAAALVSDEDNLLICGDSNSICIAAKDITIGSRPSLGTITIKDNTIISVSKV
jgi:DNA gyrase subunit A